MDTSVAHHRTRDKCPKPEKPSLSRKITKIGSGGKKNTIPRNVNRLKIAPRDIDRQIVVRNSPSQHVHRLGDTLHLDWMSATLHVALFPVGRVLHSWLVARKNPVPKLN